MLLVLGCLAASALHASDPVPVQLPPTDDSIAAAKRDLDALKRSTNSALPTPATGTGIALPAMPQGPSDDVVPIVNQSSVDAAKAAEKKRANWLVDAMMAPKKKGAGDSKDSADPFARLDRRRDSTMSGSRSSDRASDASDSDANPFDVTLDPDSRADSSGDSRSSDSALSGSTPAAPGANPLAQFMSGWMSPRDYALLRRTVETPDKSSVSDSATSAAAAVPGDSTSVLGGIDLSALSASNPALNSAAPPPDNPYVDALNAPDPSSFTASAAAPAASAIPPPPAPVFAPPPPPPEQDKSNIPDFAKPDPDDKYFKPLKRF
ncbi:MAG TPA: hypothetical protein VHE61_18675 [Opitutaceae bacterium]|nr:hypothetical protein [Opitutaceae bacterium]